MKARIDNLWVRFGIPWIQARADFEKSITDLKRADGNLMSVFSREGTSFTHPVHIPSLIGIQDRKYLDATGSGAPPLHWRPNALRHDQRRSGHECALWGFPADHGRNGIQSGGRDAPLADEQLYALSLYILPPFRPPVNPNPMDDRASCGPTGSLQQQGCPLCHTPPYYTNNKLTPAQGFQGTEPVRKTVDILNVCVGTDQVLATRTRRGTGFYKVPSLRGVWHRGVRSAIPGQADNFEEWFSPARLQAGLRTWRLPPQPQD